MNGWQFMGEHPILTVIIVFLLCCAAESVAKIVVTRGRGE